MMNMMRSTGDPAAWLEAFRTALRELFDDIDRISVDANMECKLTAPPSSTPADEAPAVQGRSGILLERLRWQQHYPFDLYHTPSVFEYLHPVSGEYLGTIILWRMSSHPPISDATLHTIVERQGNLAPEAAAEYIQALKDDHRYHRDVY